MSIGWGIRGNFGHQYGAAFAGCLASLTICLLSGRKDWRQKILYFGFFGAIGWGFGATISYMMVISYTESGVFSTQWFGYAGLFLIGFLWAALGIAATAFTAVVTTEKLLKFFVPILFVFVAWIIQDIIEDPVAAIIQPAMHFDSNWARHKNPFYWFDANYLAPFFALIAAAFYDIINRREKNTWLIILFVFAGALTGWLIQYGLHAAGLDLPLAKALTYSLGDPSYINPLTGKPGYEASDLLNNWPQWFNDFPQNIGIVTGIIAGLIFYFVRFAKFRNGSSLIVCMASGWFIFFLAFPVLGSLLFKNFGGLRMTPPRSDDWAGILGVFAGTIFWLQKNKYYNIATASIIGGTIGGIGFAGIQWVKQMMVAPGNPRRMEGKGFLPGSSNYETIVNAWANWQHQNWHSFLEQSYGFVNGIAIAIPMGLLARRYPNVDQPGNVQFSSLKKFTTAFSVIFILLIIPYVNIVKNVETWSELSKQENWKQITLNVDRSQSISAAYWDLPYIGRLPGIHFLSFTPVTWFNLTWLILLVMMTGLIRKHFKSPIAFIPSTWLGKGQLIILILLWLMVIGNFERELLQWSSERLLTEWVITINAVILTYFLTILPGKTSQEIEIKPLPDFTGLYKRSWKIALAVLTFSGIFFVLTNRWIYQYPPNEKIDTKRLHIRFGEQADWRTSPILKNGSHK